ncbi:MAG: hypothetical protein C5B49_00950 [Bdellovibrio sp.]|nr:MAG: hypothetical protein C5B49_00950 [Bdellovibrio sp.]
MIQGLGVQRTDFRKTSAMVFTPLIFVSMGIHFFAGATARAEFKPNIDETEKSDSCSAVVPGLEVSQRGDWSRSEQFKKIPYESRDLRFLIDKKFDFNKRITALVYRDVRIDKTVSVTFDYVNGRCAVDRMEETDEKGNQIFVTSRSLCEDLKTISDPELLNRKLLDSNVMPKVGLFQMCRCAAGEVDCACETDPLKLRDRFLRRCKEYLPIRLAIDGKENAKTNDNPGPASNPPSPRVKPTRSRRR